MNIIALGALAVVAVTAMLFLRQKNAEIALLIGLAASAAILLALLGSAGAVTEQVRRFVAAAGVEERYLVILLKVVGICLVTEFASNTCKDAGSAALAGNVSLAGKLMATVSALPLYADIMNTVLGLMKN
jgi:stage III sporulation protein AD